MDQAELESFLEELEEITQAGGNAYVLSGEQLEQFLAMDQRATHVAPATLQ